MLSKTKLSKSNISFTLETHPSHVVIRSISGEAKLPYNDHVHKLIESINLNKLPYHLIDAFPTKKITAEVITNNEQHLVSLNVDPCLHYEHRELNLEPDIKVFKQAKLEDYNRRKFDNIKFKSPEMKKSNLFTRLLEIRKKFKSKEEEVFKGKHHNCFKIIKAEGNGRFYSVCAFRRENIYVVFRMGDLLDTHVNGIFLKHCYYSIDIVDVLYEQIRKNFKMMGLCITQDTSQKMEDKNDRVHDGNKSSNNENIYKKTQTKDVVTNSKRKINVEFNDTIRDKILYTQAEYNQKNHQGNHKAHTSTNIDNQRKSSRLEKDYKLNSISQSNETNFLGNANLKRKIEKDSDNVKNRHINELKNSREIENKAKPKNIMANSIGYENVNNIDLVSQTYEQKEEKDTRYTKNLAMEKANKHNYINDGNVQKKSIFEKHNKEIYTEKNLLNQNNNHLVKDNIVKSNKKPINVNEDNELKQKNFSCSNHSSETIKKNIQSTIKNKLGDSRYVPNQLDNQLNYYDKNHLEKNMNLNQRTNKILMSNVEDCHVTENKYINSNNFSENEHKINLLNNNLHHKNVNQNINRIKNQNQKSIDKIDPNYIQEYPINSGSLERIKSIDEHGNSLDNNLEYLKRDNFTKTTVKTMTPNLHLNHKMQKEYNYNFINHESANFNHSVEDPLKKLTRLKTQQEIKNGKYAMQEINNNHQNLYPNLDYKTQHIQHDTNRYSLSYKNFVNHTIKDKKGMNNNLIDRKLLQKDNDEIRNSKSLSINNISESTQCEGMNRSTENMKKLAPKQVNQNYLKGSQSRESLKSTPKSYRSLSNNDFNSNQIRYNNKIIDQTDEYSSKDYKDNNAEANFHANQEKQKKFNGKNTSEKFIGINNNIMDNTRNSKQFNEDARVRYHNNYTIGHNSPEYRTNNNYYKDQNVMPRQNNIMQSKFNHDPMGQNYVNRNVQNSNFINNNAKYETTRNHENNNFNHILNVNSNVQNFNKRMKYQELNQNGNAYIVRNKVQNNNFDLNNVSQTMLKRSGAEADRILSIDDISQDHFETTNSKKNVKLDHANKIHRSNNLSCEIGNFVNGNQNLHASNQRETSQNIRNNNLYMNNNDYYIKDQNNRPTNTMRHNYFINNQSNTPIDCRNTNQSINRILSDNDINKNVYNEQKRNEFNHSTEYEYRINPLNHKLSQKASKNIVNKATENDNIYLNPNINQSDQIKEQQYLLGPSPKNINNPNINLPLLYNNSRAERDLYESYIHGINLNPSTPHHSDYKQNKSLMQKKDLNQNKYTQENNVNIQKSTKTPNLNQKKNIDKTSTINNLNNTLKSPKMHILNNDSKTPNIDHLYPNYKTSNVQNINNNIDATNINKLNNNFKMANNLNYNNITKTPNAHLASNQNNYQSNSYYNNNNMNAQNINNVNNNSNNPYYNNRNLNLNTINPSHNTNSAFLHNNKYNNQNPLKNPNDATKINNSDSNQFKKNDLPKKLNTPNINARSQQNNIYINSKPSKNSPVLLPTPTIPRNEFSNIPNYGNNYNATLPHYQLYNPRIHSKPMQQDPKIADQYFQTNTFYTDPKLLYNSSHVASVRNEKAFEMMHRKIETKEPGETDDNAFYDPTIFMMDNKDDQTAAKKVKKETKKKNESNMQDMPDF
ncbi:hypothetical protein COBT_001439 [Conglomerata obtusa]